MVANKKLSNIKFPASTSVNMIKNNNIKDVKKSFVNFEKKVLKLKLLQLCLSYGILIT